MNQFESHSPDRGASRLRNSTFPSLLLGAGLLLGAQAPTLSADPVELEDPLNQVVLVTSLGQITLQLRPDVAPKTVENFLTYVNSGAYNNTHIHRSVQGFVVQGGGFAVVEGSEGGVEVESIPTNPPVENEPNLSNVRGTVAMAKLGGDPDSATSQWFFNVGNNSANLDHQNGGFTVFAEVADGMRVVDAINNLEVWNATALHGAFEEVPLRDFSLGNDLRVDHFVAIDAAFVNFLGLADRRHGRESFRAGGWMKHDEHGWLYSANGYSQGIWMWDHIQQDWLWTRAEIYPFFYKHNDGNGHWLYYWRGGNPKERFFYDYSQGETENDGAWISVP